MTTPAQTVITKLGGVGVVQTVTGVDRSRIYRWTYPKERGGTGGRVPGRFQQPLLDYARANNLPLTPEDFFDPVPVAAE